RRDHLPEAALSLVLPAGADAHPTESAGLASLVAKVLPEGAAGRTARDMAIWVDGLGAHLGVAVGYDAMIVRLHTLSEHLEAGLDLLAAVALEPAFLDEEVERCRAERLDAIRRYRDEPAEVAADVLAELLYADHPYGRLTRGRLDSVARIDRDDLVAFHENRFSPEGALLVGCGDLPANFEDLVSGRFGGWSGPQADSRPPAAISTADSPGIVLVDRPGSGQSEIRIGGIGIRRNDEREIAARVTNAILGGLFNSRLNMNLREDKGWTYGARSSLSLRRSPGPVTLRAAVETAVTADAVREMMGEIEGLRSASPSEAEMETARGALTRSLPLRFQTNGQIAGTLVEQAVYGLEDDYWSRFPGRINLVSADQVREAAVHLLDPEALAVLVVGDAGAVRSGLERQGPVTEKEPP
ncbi:MAG: insulinase family protein, partial [marine benthic group bacterium]|nr:insulinase family protein [Candidatus Benthicola marisminoris]